MRKLHILFLNIFIFAILPVQAEIPIVAYYGVPLEHSNVNRFKEFKEAGFDVSICFYDDTPVDTLLRILDDAQKSELRDELDIIALKFGKFALGTGLSKLLK